MQITGLNTKDMQAIRLALSTLSCLTDDEDRVAAMVALECRVDDALRNESDYFHELRNRIAAQHEEQYVR